MESTPLHRQRSDDDGHSERTAVPPQSTLWRFLASLHFNVATQILLIQRSMRQRVWQSANIRLEAVTLDTDTTVHTLYGITAVPLHTHPSAIPRQSSALRAESRSKLLP